MITLFPSQRGFKATAKKSVKQSNGHPRCPRQSPTCVASLEKTSSLNFSHFVAHIIWWRRGVSPLYGKADRLQRREPLSGLLVPMDTTFDLLEIERHNFLHPRPASLAYTGCIPMPAKPYSRLHPYRVCY